MLDEDRKRVRDAQQAKIKAREERARQGSSKATSDCDDDAEKLPQKKVLTSLSMKPPVANSSNNTTSSSSGYNPLMGGGGVSGFRPSGEMRGRGNRGG